MILEVLNNNTDKKERPNVPEEQMYQEHMKTDHIDHENEEEEKENEDLIDEPNALNLNKQMYNYDLPAKHRNMGSQGTLDVEKKHRIEMPKPIFCPIELWKTTCRPTI